MPSMFLAATGPQEQVFYIIDPDDPKNDGVVVTSERISYVPFWSYVTRIFGLKPVMGSDLLRDLWSKEQAKTPDWGKKFLLREIPFTEEELLSVEFLLVPVPAERVPAAERPPGG